MKRSITVTERGQTREIPFDIVRDEPAPVMPWAPTLPAPVQTVQAIQTTHVDRSRGFLLASAPLSAIVAAGTLILAVGVFSVPVFSVGAAVVFFVAMAVVWLVAWSWFNLTSPDGVGVLGVFLTYRLLRHEQRARLDRMRGDE